MRLADLSGRLCHLIARWLCAGRSETPPATGLVAIPKEHEMTSIITQIWDTGVKDFNEVEAWVDAKVAAVEKAFPAATTTINAIGSDLKQAASDAIGMADSALNGVAPALTKTAEAAADAALTAYTGGLALPLVGLTNDAIEKIAALGVSTFNSWALNAKAALAGNNGNAVASAIGPQ